MKLKTENQQEKSIKLKGGFQERQIKGINLQPG